jgi:hypothetical protein
MTSCARCGQAVENGRRKYCSEACANAMQRALGKVRAAGERAPKRTYLYRHVSLDSAPKD